MADLQKSDATLRVTSFRKLGSMFGRKGRGLSVSRGFFRRHVWVGPVLAIVALLFAGTWLRARMEDAMREKIEGELQALLNADVLALELWLRSQEADAKAAAQETDVRQAMLELVQMADEGRDSGPALLQAPQRGVLRDALKPWLDNFGFSGFVILNRQGTILASLRETLVGQGSLPGYTDFLEAVFQGKSLVSKPFPSIAVVNDEWGQPATGVPVMFAAAPVSDDAGKIVAAIGLRIQPEKEFTRILNVARAGRTGETYAFDKQGLFLSQSRFEDQLKQIGLQADRPNSRSVLSVEIRDPGVDMTAGGRPELRRSEQPLTFPAAHAVAGTPGVNAVGYRDYRGVDSVGAWTWLPEYDFGVITEMDSGEAFRALGILRYAFWMLFGLLSAAAVAMLALTLLAGRLERRMREAVVAAKQLGQYALEEKIGEGGMGSVYRARHAMLRRPTAVKLLEPQKTTDVSIARFEREVQLTSQLNHPNTITIYDYGRTQEGIFYYAMEFLDGFALQSLVERFGPQPDGRVIQILLQVCGSLAEAHAQGLIHRDIKPANIMLTRRGGVRDYVKLLDFGLVKAIDAKKQRTLTAADTLTGTPLYMSPESIEDPDAADARSDLYSLGGVAYFLLTGRAVFDAANVLEIIRHHLDTPPVPPSERLGRPVCAQLEQLILACLAKTPDKRPNSAAALADALSRCEPVQAWTPADAERWWLAYEPTIISDRTLAAPTRNIELSATLPQDSLQPPR